jgi:hypothetical protein
MRVLYFSAGWLSGALLAIIPLIEMTWGQAMNSNQRWAWAPLAQVVILAGLAFSVVGLGVAVLRDMRNREKFREALRQVQRAAEAPQARDGGEAITAPGRAPPTR